MVWAAREQTRLPEPLIQPREVKGGQRKGGEEKYQQRLTLRTRERISEQCRKRTTGTRWLAGGAVRKRGRKEKDGSKKKGGEKNRVEGWR